MLLEKIEVQSVDRGGVTYDVSGIWKNKPYSIEIWCEFDGRDVDSISPEPNPMNDFKIDGEDFESAMPFFEQLCDDKRFVDLHDATYRIYEQIGVLNNHDNG